MSKPHRIAAGGLTFKDDAVLLVRYQESKGGTYLVGPGGALEDEENVVQAIVRETKEETGLTVQPEKVVAIEDLVCSSFKMSKVWMTCEVVNGQISNTEGAKKEGIIEVGWFTRELGWFTREQLAGEVVFPPTLMQHDWAQLQADGWTVECLPSRKIDF
jgi:ADP-ribose pyrophosphatase YjhB (NUDIX family)